MTTTPNGIPVFHADHGLGPAHLAFIDQILADQPAGFFIDAFELPADCGDLMSALYGPTAGDAPVLEDEVSYEKRGSRPGPSRLLRCPLRPCRRMVVCGIAGDDAKIFTTYGTQAEKPSPREWWDSGMKPHEALESAKFWSEHALAEDKAIVILSEEYGYRWWVWYTGLTDEELKTFWEGLGSIGWDFPSWDGIPGTLVEMEHGCGEFSTYDPRSYRNSGLLDFDVLAGDEIKLPYTGILWRGHIHANDDSELTHPEYGVVLHRGHPRRSEHALAQEGENS